MKRNLSFFLAAMAFSTIVLATPGNNGGGNGGCGVGQQTNGCGTTTQGPKGDTGAAGTNGTNGIDGKDGKDGKDGINGTNGKDGKDGVGTAGANGKDGVGIDGTNGSDGKSVKGDTGERGATGENAPDAVTVQQMTGAVAASQAAVQGQINELRGEIQGVAKAAYSGVAAALALQMPSVNPNKPEALVMRLGVGTYKGQSAVGISFRRSNKAGDWSVTGGVSATSQGTGAALGIEHSF